MELTVATPSSWDMARPYLQGASPPKVDMASLGRRDRLLAAKDLAFCVCISVYDNSTNWGEPEQAHWQITHIRLIVDSVR